MCLSIYALLLGLRPLPASVLGVGVSAENKTHEVGPLLPHGLPSEGRGANGQSASQPRNGIISGVGKYRVDDVIEGVWGRLECGDGASHRTSGERAFQAERKGEQKKQKREEVSWSRLGKRRGSRPPGRGQGRDVD